MDAAEGGGGVALRLRQPSPERRRSAEVEQGLERRLEPRAPVDEQVEPLVDHRHERKTIAGGERLETEGDLGLALEHRQRRLALGPRRGGERDLRLGDAGLVQQMFEQALTAGLGLARHLGARSIAFPAISTGVYGYPVGLAAPIALSEAAAAADLAVTFVLFSEPAREAFQAAAAVAGVQIAE